MPRQMAPQPKVLIVAPMSGHYATLLRPTVSSLLPDADVYVTDWHNARDIPVSAGKFDVEDYTLYLAEFMKFLGPDTHVIAVCQPVPLTPTGIITCLISVSRLSTHKPIPHFHLPTSVPSGAEATESCP